MIEYVDTTTAAATAGVATGCFFFFMLWATVAYKSHRSHTSSPQRPFFLLAHRGWRGPVAENDENTLEAALAVIDRPAFDGVEVDVMLTADGVPFLMHDATLGRTTTSSKASEAIDSAELAALRTVPNHQGVPRLVDVVDALYAAALVRNKPLWLYLDVKSERHDALAIIQDLLVAKNIRNDDAHLHVVCIHPNITTLPPTHPPLIYDTASFSGCGTDFAAPQWGFYLAWPLRNAFVWTVNHPLLIDLVKSVGAMAVITDLPL